MSNQAQGGAGSAILGLLMLVGIGSCVFGGSEKGDSQAAVAQPTSTVDTPFLAGDADLQQAHGLDGSSDGFREIITTKDSGCWQTVSATPVGDHRYKVICSRGQANGRVDFSSYVVDTHTGMAMRTDTAG